MRSRLGTAQRRVFGTVTRWRVSAVSGDALDCVGTAQTDIYRQSWQMRPSRYSSEQGSRHAYCGRKMGCVGSLPHREIEISVAA